jgi:hypothetical protein
MIVSKSQSQATLPEEHRGHLTSCKLGDSVLSFTTCVGKPTIGKV